MPMQAVLQIETALFRSQAPDLLLRPGSTLAARVIERNGQHGLLSLGGLPILAELPDSVKTGDKLALLVQETRGEKVLMKLVDEQPAQAPPPPQFGLVLPNGMHAQVHVDPDDAGSGGSADDPEHATIAIGYESPMLGTMGFRLTLSPGGVSVQAEVRAGAAYELADDASEALQTRLAAVTGREASVQVLPQPESFDAYA